MIVVPGPVICFGLKASHHVRLLFRCQLLDLFYRLYALNATSNSVRIRKIHSWKGNFHLIASVMSFRSSCTILGVKFAKWSASSDLWLTFCWWRRSRLLRRDQGIWTRHVRFFGIALYRLRHGTGTDRRAWRRKGHQCPKYRSVDPYTPAWGQFRDSCSSACRRKPSTGYPETCSSRTRSLSA